MDIIKKIIAVNALCILIVLRANGQNDTSSYVPTIGSQFRDYVFNDVIDYEKKELSTAQFRGKWLLIDCWTSSCVACVKSFPKMNKIAKQFEDELKVVIVGEVGSKETVRNSNVWKLYELLKKEHNLKLTAAFDKFFADKTRAFSVPYILLVDPNGRIAAKTPMIDSAQIAEFLRGGRPPLIYSYSAGESNPSLSYDSKLPALATGKESNGGVDTAVISRTVLSTWNISMPDFWYYGFFNERPWNQYANKRAEIFGQDLRGMIMIAYKGRIEENVPLPDGRQIYPELILEVSDPKRFAAKRIETGENMYAYSLVTPIADLAWRRRKLLDDLEGNFQFQSKVEDREVPVWRLTVSDPHRVEKLKSNGGKPLADFKKESGETLLQNIKFADMLGSLQKYIQLNDTTQRHPVLIDDTGISMRIDFKFPSYVRFAKVVEELRKYGLKIEKTTSRRPCIVIRDHNYLVRK